MMINLPCAGAEALRALRGSTRRIDAAAGQRTDIRHCRRVEHARVAASMARNERGAHAAQEKRERSIKP
jgi:hypothetical protein